MQLILEEAVWGKLATILGQFASLTVTLESSGAARPPELWQAQGDTLIHTTVKKLR